MSLIQLRLRALLPAGTAAGTGQVRRTTCVRTVPVTAGDSRTWF
jgi:hypothetical protein